MAGGGEASEPRRRAQPQGCGGQSGEIPTRRQEKEKTYNNKTKTIRKMVIGTYISIITLNVNGLNAPTKRHRLAEWIQKQDLYICCLQETHFRPRDHTD